MVATWFLASESENDISFAIQWKKLSIIDFFSILGRGRSEHEMTIWGEDDDFHVNRTFSLVKLLLWF